MAKAYDEAERLQKSTGMSVDEQVELGIFENSVTRHETEIYDSLATLEEPRLPITYKLGFVGFTDAFGEMFGFDPFPALAPSMAGKFAAGGTMGVGMGYAMPAVLGRISFLASRISPATGTTLTAAGLTGGVEAQFAPAIMKRIQESDNPALWSAGYGIVSMIGIGLAENAAEYGMKAGTRAFRMSPLYSKLNIFQLSRNMRAAAYGKVFMLGDMSNPHLSGVRRDVLRHMADHGNLSPESIENLAVQEAEIIASRLSRPQNMGRTVANAGVPWADRETLDTYRKLFNTQLKGEANVNYYRDIEVTTSRILGDLREGNSRIFQSLADNGINVTPGVPLSDVSKQQISELLFTMGDSADAPLLRTILEFDGVPVSLDIADELTITNARIAVAKRGLPDNFDPETGLAEILPASKQLKSQPITEAPDAVTFSAIVATRTIDNIYKKASDDLFQGYMISEYGLNPNLNKSFNNQIRKEASQLEFEFQTALARRDDPNVRPNVDVRPSMQERALKWNRELDVPVTQKEMMSLAEQIVKDKIADRYSDQNSAFTGIFKTTYGNEVNMFTRHGDTGPVTMRRAAAFAQPDKQIKDLRPTIFDPASQLDVDGVAATAERILRQASKSQAIVLGTPDEKLISIGQLFRVLDDPEGVTRVQSRDSGAKFLNQIDQLPLSERQAMSTGEFKLVDTALEDAQGIQGDSISQLKSRIAEGDIEVPPEIMKTFKAYNQAEATTKSRNDPSTWAPDSTGVSQVNVRLLEDLYMDAPAATSFDDIKKILRATGDDNDIALANRIKDRNNIDPADYDRLKDVLADARLDFENVTLEDAIAVVKNAKAEGIGDPAEVEALSKALKAEKTNRITTGEDPKSGVSPGHGSLQANRARKIRQHMLKSGDPQSDAERLKDSLRVTGSTDEIKQWVDELEVPTESKVLIKNYVDSLVQSAEFQNLTTSKQKINWVRKKMNEFAPAMSGESAQVKPLLKMLGDKGPELDARVDVLSDPTSESFDAVLATVKQKIATLEPEQQGEANALLARITSSYAESRPNAIFANKPGFGGESYKPRSEIDLDEFDQEEMLTAVNAIQQAYLGKNSMLLKFKDLRDKGIEVNLEPEVERMLAAFDAYQKKVGKKMSSVFGTDVDTFNINTNKDVASTLRANQQIKNEKAVLRGSAYEGQIQNIELAFKDQLNNSSELVDSMFMLEGASAQQFFDAYLNQTVGGKFTADLNFEDVPEAVESAQGIYMNILRNNDLVDKAQLAPLVKQIEFDPELGKIVIPQELSRELGLPDIRPHVSEMNVKVAEDAFKAVQYKQMMTRVKSIFSSAGLQTSTPTMPVGKMPLDMNVLQTQATDFKYFTDAAEKSAQFTGPANRGWLSKAKKDLRLDTVTGSPERVKQLYKMHETASANLKQLLDRIDTDYQTTDVIKRKGMDPLGVKDGGFVIDTLMIHKAVLNLRAIEDSISTGGISKEVYHALSSYKFDLRTPGNLITSVSNMAKDLVPDLVLKSVMASDQQALEKILFQHKRSAQLLLTRKNMEGRAGFQMGLRDLQNEILSFQGSVQSNRAQRIRTQALKDAEELNINEAQPTTRTGVRREPDVEFDPNTEDEGVF